MKELIVSYLLQNQNCPLPNVGSLHIRSQSAVVIQGEKLINAPTQSVEFNESEISVSGFLRFIAANSRQSEKASEEELTQFCHSLSALNEGDELSLPTLGSFRVDAAGHLKFDNEEPDAAFFPSVHAERVIHENDSHQILVGDTETTNRVMTDFFNEASPNKIDRWWLWAIILLIISAVAIFLYISGSTGKSAFGNAIKVEPKEAPSTYESGN